MQVFQHYKDICVPALLFSKYCSEKRTMYVTHSRQNSVTYNKRIPGGIYFAEYDWTCHNQVGYLNGSVCDLKFFPTVASKKYLQL
jgi:hypothetical protein